MILYVPVSVDSLPVSVVITTETGRESCVHVLPIIISMTVSTNW